MADDFESGLVFPLEEKLNNIAESIVYPNDEHLINTPYSEAFEWFSGFVAHNAKHTSDMAEKSGENRYYFGYSNHYAGLIDGNSILESICAGNINNECYAVDGIIKSAFALSYALDCEKPDRVIGVMNGALGFAATASYFGEHVDTVEAHNVGSVHQSASLREGITEAEFIDNLKSPLKPTDKVLIVEDTSSGSYEPGRKTTYGIVSEELEKKYGISPDNVSLFFGKPGHGIHSLFNPYVEVSDEDRESGARTFGDFLEKDPYFLDLMQPIRPNQIEAVRMDEWAVFKKLQERNDLDQSIYNFVERLSGQKTRF